MTPQAGLIRANSRSNPLEIAQLDNDPNYPDRGVFELTMGGGK